MDAPTEPPASRGAYSTTCEGRHYSWRRAGSGNEWTDIWIYDPSIETWSSQQTTGHPPPGVVTGGCATVGKVLYCFGGRDGSWSLVNNLHTLNLERFHWSQVYPKNSDLSHWPHPKSHCGLLAMNECTICCFGGLIGESEWTNEFHIFDVQEGVWSKYQLKGQIPPPCSAFTFTKVDKSRAILFGGFQSGLVRVNDLYLFNFKRMDVIKVDTVSGESWPKERVYHAACCLNYGEDHPQLLMFGGVGNDIKVLGDMWILDVDSGKWTEVPLPESVKPREYHSITATSLGPGLTEVLMLGGYLTYPDGDPVAETTILRFEHLSYVAGPTEKWTLDNVAHNDSRGCSQRLREKREKMTQARSSSSSDSNNFSLYSSGDNRVRALEQQLRAAEQRCEMAMQRAAEELRQKLVILDKLHDTERLLAEANHCHDDVERRLRETLQETEQRVLGTERRLMTEISQLREDLRTTQRRAQLAEQRADSLETQWMVHRREIEMTERELGGGGWGVVKVAKFRGIEVAAKSLYQMIRFNYRDLFIREMNMAARLRHPNLVQFIGATLEEEMIILTELMHTSLRRIVEQGGISREHTISISVQVCQALNYLHLMRPDPVIHRDISSANILLNPLPNNGWLAKVTDYGSVNTLRALRTECPGNPVYAAPEARVPSLQSTKMDVFSVGVLLIKMYTGRFPSEEGRERLLLTIRDQGFSVLISRCLDGERDNRPTAQELLSKLRLL